MVTHPLASLRLALYLGARLWLTASVPICVLRPRKARPITRMEPSSVQSGSVLPAGGSSAELLNEADTPRCARGCRFVLPPAARRSLRLLCTLGVRLISRPIGRLIATSNAHRCDYQERVSL
jgi:hypothetical protein